MRERDGSIPIRSFRVCFDLERRLHRIDRFRVPLPYGLPLRSIGYAAAIFLAVLIAGALPLIGALLDELPFAARCIGLPIAGGYVLTELRVDGRSGHAVACSWLRMRLSPRRLRAFRRHPPPRGVVLESIVVALDERGPRLRRGELRGRGRVYLRQPATLTPRGRTLHVRAQDGAPRRRGQRIELRPGQRMVIG